jgi:CheY-like chemotaxis protein
VVAARQVGAADRPGEQRVADEQLPARASGRPDLQADTSRTMPGRMVRARLAFPERNHLPRRVVLVDGRRRFHLQAEHSAHFHGAVVEKLVVAVQEHRHAECSLCGRDTGYMIDMRMRQKDRPDRKGLPLGEGQQRVDLVAGIDQYRLAGARTRHDEAILEERANRLRLDYDHAVILAILDDLLFTSKIRTAATQLGVPVTFARSSAGALDAMRKERPSLVILDLNNRRTDPLGTVEAMKTDAALNTIPTVAFASHVQTDVIAAAKAAGVDQVLARSAFTLQLAEILKSGHAG